MPHVAYIRVPPDSTGKKSYSEYALSLYYDNLTGSFSVGDVVVGAVSGATGTIKSIDTAGFSATEGILYLDATSSLPYVNNENLEVSASPQAIAKIETSTPSDEFYIQGVVLSDPDNPDHQQKVDRFGATLNTFTDGSPIFSPMGSMLVGSTQLIQSYSFPYDVDASSFFDETGSGGTISHETATTSVLLSTPTTSGALAKRTSHFYHPFFPGIGNAIDMSVDIGDPGKTNVRRRWGLFDDQNGLYFELDGTTFYAVARSNVSGSIVNTRVASSNFNEDSLDGTDSIGFTLDVEKGNIYWIDYNWPTGRVKFGVVDFNGDRLTAHIIKNSNINSIPYMQTGALPFRIEQENTGVAGSTSEFRLTAASVRHTSKVDLERMTHSNISGLVNITEANNVVPLISIRPKKTFNSANNKGRIKLESVSVCSDSTTNSLEIGLYHQHTVSGNGGPTWSSHSNTSITEEDFVANTVTNGQSYYRIILGRNESKHIDLLSNKTLHENELYVEADGNTQIMHSVTAKVLGTGQANVIATLNWGELVV